MFLRNIYKMKEKGYCTNEPIILKTQTNWWQEPVVCLTRTQAWNRIYHEICGFTADFAPPASRHLRSCLAPKASEMASEARDRGKLPISTMWV